MEEAERWKKIDGLVDAALELPADERGRFLASACAGDDELRREVESFLNAQSEAADFMERSAMNVAAKALAKETRSDSDASNSSTLVGVRIGAYTIERLLGAGGMGEVYLARDTRLNRRVALKILPAQFIADTERIARFEREARAISALNHPNLITIYDVGDDAGVHFIATEYVEGKTLRETAGGQLKLKEVLTIVSQVAEALSAAHQAGVVHRDIKPDNVMVRADGYVKVLDFGLAKLTEQARDGGDGDAQVNAARTQAGAVMGTSAYMSPEQAVGESLDQRTDVWSLGVVLYELATGVAPFRREDRRATLGAILNDEPEPATSRNPQLPDELDRIISKALEKDRELRYQTASDFRADLRRLLREIDSSATWTGDKVAAARRRKSRRRLLPVAVACAVLLAVAGFAAWRYFMTRTSAPDWSRATHTQLTDRAGTEFFPSLSPDGKSFLYASDQEGNFDLYVQRVGGKNPTNLTKDSTAHDTQPVFSPDGDSLAFRSEREPRGIYVMEATGENVRRVADGGYHPSWSPDGKEIVFSENGRDVPSTRNSNPSALRVVNVETGAVRVLTEGVDAMQPAWSPHGRRIAFWHMPPGVGRSDIATIPAAGGPVVAVTKDAVTNWNPVWSPDGKFLYFASDRSGQMNFWRVRVNEETGEVLSEPEAVTTPSKFSAHLNFSRDGKRMIYVQSLNQSNIRAVEFDAKAEKATGEPVWVTSGDRQVVRPELSPDGKQFVMRVPRRTQDDIVLVNRDGTNWRDLTNDQFFDRYPRWSPDGKSIAFISDRTGKYEIWAINADGTNLRQLTFDSPLTASFPLWSPDGRRLIYRRDETDSIIIDLNKPWGEHEPQALPRFEDQGGALAFWDWSPDGTKLAGMSTRGISYYSFETNSYELVVNVYSIPVWMPDSGRIIYTHNGKVFVADIATKKTRELYSRPDERIRSANVSRDGRLLYYTVLQSESDIWMLSLD